MISEYIIAQIQDIAGLKLNYLYIQTRLKLNIYICAKLLSHISF